MDAKSTTPAQFAINTGLRYIKDNSEKLTQLHQLSIVKTYLSCLDMASIKGPDTCWESIKGDSEYRYTFSASSFHLDKDCVYRKLFDTNVKVPLTHLALAATNRFPLLESGVMVGDVVTHLCFNRWCINPNHLVVENPATNRARRSCLEKFGNTDWNASMCSHSTVDSLKCKKV